MPELLLLLLRCYNMKLTDVPAVVFSVFYRSVYTVIKLISHKSRSPLSGNRAVYEGLGPALVASRPFEVLKKMCFANDKRAENSVVCCHLALPKE